MHLDASLTGLGRLVYALQLSVEFATYHITQLEMLNVLVVLKARTEVCRNTKLKYHVIIWQLLRSLILVRSEICF